MLAKDLAQELVNYHPHHKGGSFFASEDYEQYNEEGMIPAIIIYGEV